MAGGWWSQLLCRKSSRIAIVLDCCTRARRLDPSQVSSKSISCRSLDHDDDHMTVVMPTMTIMMMMVMMMMMIMMMMVESTNTPSQPCSSITTNPTVDSGLVHPDVRLGNRGQTRCCLCRLNTPLLAGFAFNLSGHSNLSFAHVFLSFECWQLHRQCTRWVWKQPTPFFDSLLEMPTCARAVFDSTTTWLKCPSCLLLLAWLRNSLHSGLGAVWSIILLRRPPPPPFPTRAAPLHLATFLFAGFPS